MMEIKTVYISNDKKTFDSESDCLRHERMLELFNKFLRDLTYERCGDTILSCNSEEWSKWIDNNVGQIEY